LSRYLITGCAGFLGSHLTEALLEQGNDVVGVDGFTDFYSRDAKYENLARARASNRFSLIEGHLTELDADRLLDGVSGVFHLAAQAGVRGSWGSSFSVYLTDNVLSTQRLFGAVARAAIRIVFASSSSVYGNAETYPTTEETPPRPISPYGVTKLGCEQLMHAFRSELGLDAVALRYFTVYGPRQRPDMAFTRMLSALLRGDVFTIYGSGQQSRDFTYAGDVVAATIAAMDAPRPGSVYNVSGGSEASLRDVIHISEELVGRRLAIENHARAVGDVQRTAGDTTRIHRDLGWAPSTTLSEGLAAQIGWLQDPTNVAPSSGHLSAWPRSSRQRDGRSRPTLPASSWTSAD
jgi:UDP-glucuronate 4-epimerase